jgi:hypothetical protein
MTVAAVSRVSAPQTDQPLVSDLFHAISQPLTALECGLELSLHRDKSAAEFRRRVETALVNAKLLHRRLLEARALHDALQAGDTSVPIAIKGLLLQIREELLPVGKSAKVTLDVKCETAMIHGNAARFRNGFFYLVKYLLRNCTNNHQVSIHAQRVSLTAFEVSFRNSGSARIETADSTTVAELADLGLRIAQRTFRAAGGDLVLAENGSGQIAGNVLVLLAN